MLEAFRQLGRELERRVLGQHRLVERLLVALLADGHLLVEGAPGLAKTRSVRTLAALVGGGFRRVQFTPDLLPSDITGAEIYLPEEHRFEFQPGPLFNHLVLADEINRAPAKVQSALLEAMAERQVTAGHETYRLPSPFLVMATQNPIEQEGTYPLPEAQLDRFLLQVFVDYPDAESENRILELARTEEGVDADKGIAAEPLVSPEDVLAARERIRSVHTSAAVQDYLVRLVLATREPPSDDPDLADEIEHGASPRATIALDRACRARAWLDGRDYVTPDDVQDLAPDALRHRLRPTLAAEARGITCEAIVGRLLERVPVDA